MRSVNNSVIITGASGFIGHSLADYFLEQDSDVTGLRELSFDGNSISSLVAGVKPSFLIHAAGSASAGKSRMNSAQHYSNSVALFRRARKS
jgi:nucleoside-diphosphate-sugar epimerase